MNLSYKCNCCVCQAVCKYKQIYQRGIEAILDTMIVNDNGGFWKLKDCPHIEVTIKCPHIVSRSERSDNNAE